MTVQPISKTPGNSIMDLVNSNKEDLQGWTEEQEMLSTDT